MKNQSVVPYFLNTRISAFNELFSRDPRFGIPFPDGDVVPSAITVIKGEAGCGKSVISSVLASNLLLQHPVYYKDYTVNLDKKCRILPIYFTFSQPANGIRNYINSFLSYTDEAGQWHAPDSKRHHPPILFPKARDRVWSSEGLKVLERQILQVLAPFQSEHADTKSTLKDKLERLRGTEFYNVSCDLDVRSLEECKIVPFIIIDSINYFFNFDDSRTAVASLINSFRLLQWPVLLTLEHTNVEVGGRQSELEYLVGFEADIVLELSQAHEFTARRTMAISKSRLTQPLPGKYQYRIESEGHSLREVPSELTYSIDWSGPDGGRAVARHNPGLFIFPSIHKFLSDARDRKKDVVSRKAGIPALDLALGSGTNNGIESDAFVVVRGDRGRHKLSVAFNLLVAGLWADRRPVIMFSLGEELDDGSSRIALAGRTMYLPLDEEGQPAGEVRVRDRECNRDHIRRIIPPSGEPECVLSKAGILANQHPKTKIFISTPEWRDGKKPDLEVESGLRPMLVEIELKPGHTSVSEFLWIFENMVHHFEPSRVLFENTAHLAIRFPELSKQPLLFPALNSLARNRNFMLIVHDITGSGSNESLSYGVAASADYVLNLGYYEDFNMELNDSTRDWNEFSRFYAHYEESRIRVDKGAVLTAMSLNNIRGRNYVNIPMSVGIVDALETEEPPYLLVWSSRLDEAEKDDD